MTKTGIFANVLSSRVIRFASQLGFVLIAAVFLLFSMYRLTQIWLVPEVRVAVSNRHYQDLFSALAKVTDPALLKVNVRTFSDTRAVKLALEKGDADFAVARTDQNFPTSGLSAAILREDPLIIMRFGGVSVTKPKDVRKSEPKATFAERIERLSGQRLGVIDTLDNDAEMIKAAVANVSNLTIVRLDVNEIRNAIIAQEVDAIALVGSPNHLRQIVAPLVDLKPELLALDVAALGAEILGFEKITLAPHSLSENIPAEDFHAVAISWRLVARKDTERTAVAALLQSLFANRLELARETPLAWPMKGLADDGATFAKFPNHRGALDYYNREQQTFLDLYGDWLWLAVFAAGGLSSGIAWLIQILFRRRQRVVESLLDRLLEILGEARKAQTAVQLDELTRELDGLVTHAIRQVRLRTANSISTAALTLAVDSSRDAIADRRLHIWRNQPER